MPNYTPLHQVCRSEREAILVTVCLEHTMHTTRGHVLTLCCFWACKEHVSYYNINNSIGLFCLFLMSCLFTKTFLYRKQTVHKRNQLGNMLPIQIKGHVFIWRPANWFPRPPTNWRVQTMTKRWHKTMQPLAQGGSCRKSSSPKHEKAWRNYPGRCHTTVPSTN